MAVYGLRPSFLSSYNNLYPSNVTAVATSNMAYLFLKGDGSLSGDLVTTALTARSRLCPAGLQPLRLGENFAIFLKDDGSLWGFGWDNAGQLGDGPGLDEFNNDVPTKIVPNGVTAIAAGEYQTPPVYQKRRQPVGHGRQWRWAVRRWHR